MLNTVILIIGVPIVMCIIIYKMGQWDNFINIIKWITKKEVKTKQTNKDKLNMEPFTHCPYCGKTIQRCPYCKVAYCEKCNLKIEGE